MCQGVPISHEGSKVWANLDLPHSVRTARKLLLDPKRLLVDWKLNKKAIRIEEETMTLYIEEKRILRMEVSDGALCLHWLEQTWGKWQALTISEEFQALLAAGVASLKQRNCVQKATARGRQRNDRVNMTSTSTTKQTTLHWI